MIILAILITSLMHFSLQGWENVLFELGSEKVKRARSGSKDDWKNERGNVKVPYRSAYSYFM